MGMLRLIDEGMQKLMNEADDQELELALSNEKYVRAMTWSLWLPTLVAAIIAVFENIFCKVLAIALCAHKQPILISVYSYGEVTDNFVVALLGSLYSLVLGSNIFPLWHSFVTCLMKYVHLKLMILNKRASKIEILRINSFLDLDLLTPYQLNLWRIRLIAYFVKEHLEIRSFVKEFEQLIRLPVLIDFIIFSVSICFQLYAFT
ncbi:odorant receptor 56a-like [Drosophila madeirensis]|uniref:Odorant receptor 56a-like n=1 Tax=Drosophila madeirensis TaxID=30013 RepID=A0AAU9G636_DROMD